MNRIIYRLFAENQTQIPGYFNLVMATGIVSIAAWMLDLNLIGYALFYFNVVAYIVLLVRFFHKLTTAFDQVLSQLAHHRTAPAYFTIIAATGIFGVQTQWMGFGPDTQFNFWGVAVFLWLIISYAFFALITVSRNNPGIEKGLDGSWLVSVVATQSIAVLGSYHALPDQEILIFALVAFFMIGCLLYLILITLIFYRLIFMPLQASQLEAPYWINMGAVAITTLAGSRLIPHLETSPLAELSSFFKGMTVFFWSVGTWWIPLLIILGIWRHFYHKIPFPWTSNGYRISYWSMVFPLGMYTVCTLEMAEVLHVPFLSTIPYYFIFIALAAWLMTGVGMVASWVSKFT